MCYSKVKTGEYRVLHSRLGCALLLLVDKEFWNNTGSKSAIKKSGISYPLLFN